MDLVMPRLDGITAIEQIITKQAAARILVLTSFEADDKVFPAIRAAALGYTLKDFGPAELVRTIARRVLFESSLTCVLARDIGLHCWHT